MKSTFFWLLFVISFCHSIGLSQSLTLQDVISTRPSDDDVIKLAGANIGFLRARRAVISENAGRLVLSGAVEATEKDALGPMRPGVVYNYAMQLYGLVSGELSFELKQGVDLSKVNLLSKTAPKLVIAPSVYVVSATSGEEFVQVLTILQKSTFVRWVEPSILYVPEVIE
jgi:hypothetical protein